MQAYDPVHFPVAPGIFPDRYKPAGFGYGVGLMVVKELVVPDFHSTKTLYFMHFDTFLNQFPGNLPANIGFNAFDDLSAGIFFNGFFSFKVTIIS